jgi:Cof subfamily protein (haloacid dehalogenase superfamily)
VESRAQTRLVASDLDGTLLRSDLSVSDRTQAAIHALLEAGVEFVAVTARGPRGVAEVADRNHIGSIAICSNGAIVLDLATREILSRRSLETAVAQRLVEGLRERLPGILFAVEQESFAHEPGFAAWDWEPPSGTRVADAIELLAEPAVKLILRHETHELDVLAAAARELAGEHASVAIPGPWTVEISAAGVNKAAALADVCAAQGIAAEAVVAFGDYPSDLPMIAWAGRGIAVANAHPDVLAAADEVTASNDEDGVAVVLERLL